MSEAKIVLTFEVPVSALNTFDGGPKVNTVDNIEDALMILARTFERGATATDSNQLNGETYLVKGEVVQ